MKSLGRIPGYEKSYVITSTGVVFSMHRNWKWMSTRKSNSGYEMVKLYGGEKPKLCTVHRLVALTFLANPLNKPFVNHKDGDKFNNDVDNLEWATVSENLQHAYMTGLMSHKGSKNSMAKLKESDINPIRRRIKAGDLFKHIAMDYSVHYSVISGIAYDKIWEHVQKEMPPGDQLEVFNNNDYERSAE